MPLFLPLMAALGYDRMVTAAMIIIGALSGVVPDALEFAFEALTPGTLADFHHLPRSGRAHRALADAEVTAHLLLQMQLDVQARYATALGGTASGTVRQAGKASRLPEFAAKPGYDPVELFVDPALASPKLKKR